MAHTPQERGWQDRERIPKPRAPTRQRDNSRRTEHRSRSMETDASRERRRDRQRSIISRGVLNLETGPTGSVCLRSGCWKGVRLVGPLVEDVEGWLKGEREGPKRSEPPEDLDDVINRNV